MGVWGTGNFEDDTSLDHLSELRKAYKLGKLCADLLGVVEDAMDDPSSLEPDEYEGVIVPCNLEIVAQMMDTFGSDVCKLPKPKVIEKWKKTYLKVWDGYIDELEPERAYRDGRREVLGNTFDRVLEL